MGLFYQPQTQELDVSGDTLAGAKLNFFITGDVVRKDTFTDKALTIAHTNPVIADASGRFEPIYTDGSYKIELTDKDDTVIWTEDDITFGGAGAYNSVVAITSTTSITATQERKHLRVTGTTTLNLLAVTSATDGFMFSLKNDGTSLVTIDPNSSEQINDSTTIVLAPGDGGDVICDGTEWSYTGNVALKQWNKGADKASATALDISAVDGNYFDVTGTTTITSITTTGFIGSVIKLHFDGALTLTHDATNLILPAGVNILTVAGDEAELIEYASGDYRLTNYTRSDAQVQFSKGADVVSATALPILADGNYFDVTGTTTITSINTTNKVGTVIKLHFDAILILTNSAADLVLPGGENITTAAGDEAEFIEFASGDFRCTSYTRADGKALIGIKLGTAQVTTSGTAFDFTGIPAGTERIVVMFSGVSLSGTDGILVQLGDAGGIETTAYVSTSIGLDPGPTAQNSTAGMIVSLDVNAASILSGGMILTRIDGNEWINNHAGKLDTVTTVSGGGNKTLSAELTQLRITRDGTNTFDAGKVNITFE